MLRKIGLAIAGFSALLVLVLISAYLLTMPESLPEDSNSAQWLRPGPFSVGVADTVFVDESRGTTANNEAPSIASRTFATSIWYPEDGEGNYPLVLHSHGFVSERSDLAYVAQHLASYGYVVAAANFPLTSGATAGGPNANDLVNQPTDVSFLIDSVLNLSGGEKPFAGNIDASRIGLMGYSLGGLTTSLATFHPRLRDERIKAAVSIAGPSAGLVSKFYESTAIPFMMIAGTLDALIDFDANAVVIPERVRNSVLVEISGGTHLGFSAIAEPLLRFMNHPDSLGCTAVLSSLDEDPNAALIPLGTEADGIVLDPDIPAVCATMPTEKALHPGRQHMITNIAVLSFFDYVFDADPARQQDAYRQLSSSLASEFPEAKFRAATNQLPR